MLQKIYHGLFDACYITTREMKALFHDDGALLFILGIGLIYPLLYTYIYNPETVHDVPAVCVDMCDSKQTREFIRKLDASPNLRIAYHAAEMEEARELLRKQRAYGIFYFPENFDWKLQHGEQATVKIFCDMSGLLYYKSMLSTATDVSLLFNARIKAESAAPTTDRQAEVSSMPVNYHDISLFNPQKGMASFLIPAVLMLILQQSMLLSTGIMAGTAREQNTLRALVPMHKKYAGTFRIVLGKGLCYLTIYILIAAYILVLVPHMFRLVQIGHTTTLALFILPYLLSCTFFALTISTLMKEREMVILVIVFTSVPILFISGISWPNSAIPPFWKAVSCLLPSTFGINGYVKINTIGANLHTVSTEYQALWIQTVVYFITACLCYRHQLLLTYHRKHQRFLLLKRRYRHIHQSQSSARQ